LRTTGLDSRGREREKTKSERERGRKIRDGEKRAREIE
jgi:hypothetical protein